MSAKVLKKNKNVRSVSVRNGGKKVNSKVKPKGKSMDYTFLVLVIIMLCFGLVMILSASAPASNTKLGNSYMFFLKQSGYTIVGVIGMFIISKIDYHRYKKYTKLFMLGTIVLLALVLIPFIGKLANGARRWIPLGPIQIQPSEFAKIAVAMHFAYMVEHTKGKLSSLKDLIPYILWLAVIVSLMMFEPHMSGAIVICAIGAMIMFVGGLNLKWIFGGGLAGAAFITACIVLLPNKRARFLNFLDPFSDAKNIGYQVVQSIYAISSGGAFGLGLGQSRQKYSFLPEPYNDFIFSVICEELGMFGALLVMALFIFLAIRGMKIASESPDIFGSLLVVGITSQIIIQAILNMAVATSTIPNTGVSLPFFSYGGTAIVMLLAEVGIVLNVSRYSRKKI